MIPDTTESGSSTPSGQANNQESSQPVVHDNCAICRSTLEGGHLSTTPCGHTFHFSCMRRSMNTSNTCPICRADIRPPSPVETAPIVTSESSRRVTSRTTRRGGRSSMGIISAISSRPVHVDNSGNNEATTTNRERRERYPTRELDDDDEIHVDIDIEEFANDEDIRGEILSGLIHSTCRQGNLSAARDLIVENPDLLYSRGDMGDLLTHEAVLSESESMLMYIINEQSMDVNLPNSVHMYPIHYAVMSGSLRMVTILVNRGAHVDCFNDSKMTPLMLSCESDEAEITQFLLDRGASFRTQDGTGNLPIHVASKAKSYSCVTKLISAGSSVNVKNHFHDTPLHISCRLGFHSVSRLLLEEGANPETDNKFDYSPLDEASSSGNTRMRNLLSRYV